MMGCREIQFLVTSAILEFLFIHLPREEYVISINAVVLHLDKYNNLSSNMVIFDRTSILAERAKSKYTSTLPRAILVVEIFDEEAIPSEPFTWVPELAKTERLMAWGVPEVVWIYPQLGKIIWAWPGDKSGTIVRD